MKAPFETSLPSWQDALDRFSKLKQLKAEYSERRIKTLALLWLSFRHMRAREIAEFPLFIRPQVSGEEDTDLLRRLQSEIATSPERAWLIEGDAGMGKTTLCHYLCNEHWEAFLAGQQARIPLYIYLLDNMGQSNKTYLEAVILWLKDRVSQNLLPEDITLDEADCAWLIQQPLLLILDGFDELAEKKNYYHVNRWADRAFQHDIKVFYGCRPEALELENRLELFGAPRISGREPTYQGYVLKNLQPGQISTYIEIYASHDRNASGFAATWYKEWLQKLPGLDKVIEVPQLLRIVLDILPAMVSSIQEDSNVAVQQHFTRWRIYEEFVLQWIREQAARIRGDGHTSQGGLLYKLKGSLEGYLFSYISNLASTLWSHNLGHITNRSLSSADTLACELMEPRYRGSIKGGSEVENAAEDEYRKLLKNYQDNDKGNVFSAPEAIKIIRARSLLRIDDRSYRFTHKTVIEYLTMGSMTYNLRNQFSQFMRNLQLVDVNSKNRFDINLHPLRTERNMMLNFVEQFKGNDYFRYLLFDILQGSKTVSGLDIAASNAITLLNAMGENFSNLDLSGVQIPYADLRGSLCDNTNFRSANLQGVWFHGAWMRAAILSGANLTGVDFGKSNLLKHAAEVECVAYYVAINSASADNKYWLVGCSDGYVYQWSNKTLEMVRKYNIGHSIFFEDQCVTHIAIHDESDLLLAKSQENDITLCSLITGRHIKTIKGTSKELAVVLSPNGKLIASGCKNTLKLSLWSVASGDYLRSLDRSGQNNYNPLIFCFSAGSDMLATANDDFSVALWSVETGAHIKTLASNSTGKISRVTFSSNGEILAAGYQNGQVALWFINRDYSLLTFKDHAGPVDSISFTNDGNLISVLSSFYVSPTVTHTKCKCWDITAQVVRIDEEFSYKVMAIIESHMGSTVALSYLSLLYLESLDSRALNNVDNRNLMHRMGSKDKVSDIVFNFDQTYFASWNQCHGINLFLTENGECVQTLTGHTSDVRGIAFSPNGEWLASWAEDGMVMLWSMKKIGSVMPIQAHRALVKVFTFSENSSMFATAGGNSTKVWSVRGECLFSILTRSSAVEFSAHDSLVAFYGDNNLTFWAVEFSADGSPVASYDSNHLIFWSPQHKQCELQFHISNIYSAKYVCSSDNNLLAVNVDENVQIWSKTDGKYRKIYDISGYFHIRGLRFLDNNKILAFLDDKSRLIRITLDRGSITKVKLPGEFPICLSEDDDLLMACVDKKIGDRKVTQVNILSINSGACVTSFNLNLYATRYQLLFGGSMLLAFNHFSFGLFDFKTGRYVLGLDLAASISKIRWLGKQSMVLIALGEDDGRSNPHTNVVLCYSYNSLDNVKWQLLWARGGVPTNFYYTELNQSVNIPFYSLVALEKCGAIGKVAPPEAVYNPLHSLILPLPKTAHVGLRPSSVQVKGLELTISPTIWVVSVAKKQGDSKHTFLILEGVVNFRQFIIKADLTTPGTAAVINVLAVDGTEYTLEDFRESMKHCDAQSWQISKESGLKLIGNIREDQCTTISYKILGDQGGKRDALGNEYHNCVTWCRKQLRLIDILLPDLWYNLFVTLPGDVINQNVAIAVANTSAMVPNNSLALVTVSKFLSTSNFFPKSKGVRSGDSWAAIFNSPKKYMSVLDQRRLINDEQWAVSLVRNKISQRVFLIFQGRVNDQSILILPGQLPISLLADDSTGILALLCQSTQPGVLRSAKSVKIFLKDLSIAHEFQGCLLSTIDAEKLLRLVILKQNRGAGLSGSFSSFSSGNTLDLQNYIDILQAGTGFVYAENWHPTEIFDQLELVFSEAEASQNTPSALSLGGGANDNNSNMT
jgi:WD40 repeat protein